MYPESEPSYLLWCITLSIHRNSFKLDTNLKNQARERNSVKYVQNTFPYHLDHTICIYVENVTPKPSITRMMHNLR